MLRLLITKFCDYPKFNSFQTDVCLEKGMELFMKIEKLTENKIRIIINLDELSKKNIDINSLAINNEKAHKLFQSILKEAEKQVGFKVKDCRLLVEIYSTQEGYIIFTLTKYQNELNTSKSLANSKTLKFKRKSLDNNYKNTIYKFETFEEFCSFCTYCNNTKLSSLDELAQKISLYEFKNSYYLIFSNIHTGYKYLNLFYTTISEFSNLVSTSIIFRSRLNERGKAIFKTNAIKKCIEYFVKI